MRSTAKESSYQNGLKQHILLSGASLEQEGANG